MKKYVRDANDYKVNKVYRWQDVVLIEEITALDDQDAIPATPYISSNTNGPTPQVFQQGPNYVRSQADTNTYGVPIHNRYEPLQQDDCYASDGYHQQDYDYSHGYHQQDNNNGWNSPGWAPP